MTKIDLQIHDNVITVINKIKGINDSGIELVVPQGSILFENILNLKLIEKYAEDSNVTVHFSTEDEIGNILLSNISGNGNENFIEEEISEQPNIQQPARPRLKISIPKIHIPVPKVGLVIPLLGLVFIGVYVMFGLRAPKAVAKITVNSQPLTKSITIRVKDGATTSASEKLLKGTIASTNVEAYQEKDTTGEKTVGEKAEGKVTVYNKTSADIKLEEGDELVYKGKSTDLSYYLKDDVTVPASTPDPVDPAIPNTPGEAVVEIQAEDIGDSYNVDADKSFEFEDYEKSELGAKSKGEISGGKSELVKVVSEDDIKAISSELLEKNKQSAETSIIKSLQSGYKIIAGSTSTSITEEIFSHKAGEEAKKVTLQQKVAATGLIYNEKDLNSLLDELVQEFVPQGFILSEAEREVKVEILGNSTNSVLSSSEADIQVTLKTHVIPDISVDDLKNDLKGKSPSEAEKIIGSVRNVKNYEFNITPGLPFFQKVPSDLSRISVEITHE